VHRVVLDTSVFVSSLLVKEGVPARILGAWRDRHFLLVSSRQIIAEIRSTLSYPRIRAKYPVTDEDVDALVELVEKEAVLAPAATDVSDSGVRDPDDAHVLAAAADVDADALVTSDDDLLVLGSYRGTPILKPREFLQTFRLATDEVRYADLLARFTPPPRYLAERPLVEYGAASPKPKRGRKKAAAAASASGASSAPRDEPGEAEEMGGEAPCQLARFWDVEG
jgi:uncharacterized protein